MRNRDWAESKPAQPRPQIEWNIWFQWLLATTIGWVIGWAVLGEPGIGAAVGIGQWLVLRGLLRQAGWWILASAAGWGIAWALIGAGLLLPLGPTGLASVAASALLGAGIGTGQWLILRRQISQAGWWIPASIAGWTVGLTAFMGITLVGAIVGVLTGFMLDWLLRYAHLEE